MREGLGLWFLVDHAGGTQSRARTLQPRLYLDRVGAGEAGHDQHDRVPAEGNLEHLHGGHCFQGGRVNSKNTSHGQIVSRVHAFAYVWGHEGCARLCHVFMLSRMFGGTRGTEDCLTVFMLSRMFGGTRGAEDCVTCHDGPRSAGMGVIQVGETIGGERDECDPDGQVCRLLGPQAHWFP